MQTAADERIEELIIRSAKEVHQKLPVLEVIFDRFVLALGPVMKAYTGGTPSEAELKELSYKSFEEILEDLPPDWLTMVGRITPDEGTFGVLIDPKLLFTTIEIMLGGRTNGLGKDGEWKPRSFSMIERRLGQRLVEAVLAELATAFEQVSELHFGIDRTESSPKTLVLAPPSAACVRVTLQITFEDRGGELTFILPHTSFEHIRGLLAKPFRGGELGGDSSWRDLLTETLQDTEIEIDAVLHEPKLHLNEILAWQPGDVIDLGVTTDQEVTVSCSDLKMFRAAVGRRRNGAVALRVTREYNEKEDLTDVAFD